MTKQEILELIKEAKELGLTEITVGDIHMKFNTHPENTPKKGDITPEIELNAEDLVAKMNPYDELTDEEIQSKIDSG
jgi:hypothetical protein